MLLYKASPQFNPSNRYDNKYWNEAYEAAKKAYDFCISQGIKLTDKYSDNWLCGWELGGCISYYI